MIPELTSYKSHLKKALNKMKNLKKESTFVADENLWFVFRHFGKS
jgi:hypothetical protein